MKKDDKTPKNVWDTPVEETVTAVEPTVETPKEVKADKTDKSRRITKKAIAFDMEGLQTDFPTAKDLEQFVYDRTGYILQLKGLANAVKYQIAMDTLNGVEPDEDFLTTENPYLEKKDLVPVDPMKVLPPRDPSIDEAGPEVNTFHTNLFPHPDPDWKAQGQSCTVQFVKYANGMITYEILGPIAQRAVGERVNKFGQRVPEKYIWVDPRTGEQVVKRGDGSMTPLGTRLRAFMRKQRMNNSNQWDIWVDRDFVVAESYINDNPWATN